MKKDLDAACGVGTLIDDTPDGVFVKVPYCDAWSCEFCRPRRVVRCEICARRGRPNYFLTLTWWTELGLTPLEARKLMGEKWPLLRRRMEREIGKRIPFYLAVEETEKGWPHFHILLRSDDIPQGLIAKWWRELTGSYIVEWKAVWSVGNVASYLHKYVGMALKKFGNCKRYWMSRDWELPPEDAEKVKEYIPRKLRHTLDWKQDVKRAYGRQGYMNVPGRTQDGWDHMIWPLYGARDPPPPPVFRVREKTWATR